MRLKNITLAGFILLALAFTAVTGMAQTKAADNANASDITVLVDDIKEHEGSIGPGHALYGLMIAFENLGTTFTFNPEEKLGKQVANARQRIAEAKAELRKNNTKAAEIAFEKYEEEIEEADSTLSGISGDNAGLVNAQLRIANHQYVLKNLLNQTPNSTGLQRAYNNSLNLEKKFRSKTARKFVQVEMEDGRKGLKEEHDDSENGLNRIQIKAEVTNNGSTVNIDLRFQTNSTNETDIAADTLEELQNLRINLSENLKFENDSIDVEGSPSSTFATSGDDEKDSKDYKVKLAIKAQVKGNVTDVKVEYKFHLNETTREGIVDGIDEKLSQLNFDQILKGLDLKVLEHKKVETGKEIEKSNDIERAKPTEGIKAENRGERAKINIDSRNED